LSNSTNKSSRKPKSTPVKKATPTRKKPVSKNTQRPKRKTKQEIEKEHKIKYELKLIGLIVFTLFSMIGLYTKQVGIIGVTIKNLYLGLFSYVGYILPVFIFAFVFLQINFNLKPVKTRMTLAFLLILLATILTSTLLVYTGVQRDIFVLNQSPFNLVYLNEAFKNGQLLESGGVVGNYITLGIISLVGTIGTYLIIIALFVVGFIVATRVSLQDLFEMKRKEAKERRIIKDEEKAILDQMLMEQLEIDENSKVAPVKGVNKNQKVIDNDYKPTFLDTLEAHSRLKRHKNIKAFDYDVYENASLISKEQLNKDVSEAEVMEIVNKDRIQEKKNEETADLSVETPLFESFRESKPDIQSKQGKKSEVIQDVEVTKEIEKNKERIIANYILPTLDLLNEPVTSFESDDKLEYIEKAKILEETLNNFNVDAKVVSVKKGPAITMFEVHPSPGVKVSKIVGLSDDIALSLATSHVRIAPIPGKTSIGIEVPNLSTSLVSIREVLISQEFKKQKSKLAIGLGKDISGNPIIGDLSSMPHLLIAGATGSGKSVCVNTIISSILFNATPEEVKFLMIDPKVVELSNYNGIPHLILPVVTDAKKAAIALNWAVNEMTRRYKLFAELSVRDMGSYNRKINEDEEIEKLPQIVVIIDELADLMMVAPNQVEDAICRLAQMARAAGIHLIVATQRPSVDVITGLIKANIPSRIAFSVSSAIDSRTIIDMGGAEKLLGKGDMLYYPVGAAKPKRAQGAFMSDDEVESLVSFIKSQTESVSYNEDILEETQNSFDLDENTDEYLEEAIKFVVETESASASLMQRKFRVGYNRAARLIDSMEERGIVGPPRGSKPREVLMTSAEYQSMVGGETIDDGLKQNDRMEIENETNNGEIED